MLHCLGIVFIVSAVILVAIGGLYLLLRRWQLPADASILGAVTYAFSGFFLAAQVVSC